MNTLAILGTAVALSVVVVLCFGRFIQASAADHRASRLVAVLWGPLLMVLPGLGLGRGGSDMLLMGGFSAITLGPVVAAIGVPILLLTPRGSSRWRSNQWHFEDRIPLAWPAIVVLLLCFAVAGRVPEFITLVGFAVGAVLLWMETIPKQSKTHAIGGDGWLLIALVAAGGLTWCSSEVVPAWPMCLVSLLLAVAVLGQVAGPLGQRSGIMAAGWAAALSPALGLAVLGQDGLRGAILNAVSSEIVFVGYPTIGGLEVLILPGLLTMLVCGLLAGSARWSSRRARSGAVLVAAVGFFAAAALVAASN